MIALMSILSVSRRKQATELSTGAAGEGFTCDVGRGVLFSPACTEGANSSVINTAVAELQEQQRQAKLNAVKADIRKMKPGITCFALSTAEKQDMLSRHVEQKQR